MKIISAVDLFYKIYLDDYRRGELRDAARVWVEAENLYDLKKIIVDWFNEMEYLNSSYTRLSLEDQVTEFIEELEDKNDRWRILEVGSQDWTKFPMLAKISLMQNFRRIAKTSEQILQETQERLESGELLPPLKTIFDHDAALKEEELRT